MKNSKIQKNRDNLLEQIILVEEIAKCIPIEIDRNNANMRINKLVNNIGKLNSKRVETELNNIKNFVSGTLNKTHYAFVNSIKYEQ